MDTLAPELPPSLTLFLFLLLALYIKLYGSLHEPACPFNFHLRLSSQLLSWSKISDTIHFCKNLSKENNTESTNYSYKENYINEMVIVSLISAQNRHFR